MTEATTTAYRGTPGEMLPGSFEGPTTWSSTNPSNPGMPGNIFGIKFEFDSLPKTEPLKTQIQFESRRTPVWSDFYAKDGKAGTQGEYDNAVWNAGFLAEDPSAPPADRSVGYHILAPDTSIVQPPPGVTPELPASALLLLTLIPAAWAGTRKRR